MWEFLFKNAFGSSLPEKIPLETIRRPAPFQSYPLSPSYSSLSHFDPIATVPLQSSPGNVQCGQRG